MSAKGKGVWGHMEVERSFPIFPKPGIWFLPANRLSFTLSALVTTVPGYVVWGHMVLRCMCLRLSSLKEPGADMRLSNFALLTLRHSFVCGTAFLAAPPLGHSLPAS